MVYVALQVLLCRGTTIFDSIFSVTGLQAASKLNKINSNLFILKEFFERVIEKLKQIIPKGSD